MSDPLAGFMCGVVEGFYSKPWSQDQRLDLYDKMKTFGLNTYVYAPKDDAKHRALWRELYVDSELRYLKKLMSKCEETGVTFVYGISPGLDITYSKRKEIALLKAKLEQLKKLGCKGFALLWDDIDTNLPPEDEEAFETLADAQVSVSNEVHAHLGRPPFLLCPVEYCSSRAEPNVRKSSYLKTLGRDLDKDIKVFWTGSKVVSEHISVEEIKELGEVLQRKPVIWDNLHANDYDQQRFYLGPFKGRPSKLIPYLSGVLTNPNCEYSFNVPVLYTLGAWLKSFNDKRGEEYDPIKASKDAIAHFKAEICRKTSVSSVEDKPATKGDGSRENDFQDPDIELLFHLYWLPYSHGPKAKLLLDEFHFLKKHACIMQNVSWNSESRGSDSPESCDQDESPFVFEWIRRYSVFNDCCRKVYRMLDKWTYVPNRELFFDINPYLSNLQVILRACNRYLKWTSMEKCSKPINGGPSLAGLMGGFAGDLQRLYPIQSLASYPLRGAVPSHDYLTVRPLLNKDRNNMKGILKTMSNRHVEQIGESLVKVIASSIVEQSDSQGYVVERDDGKIMALIVATKHVSNIIKAAKKAPYGVSPDEKFDSLTKHDVVAAFFCTQSLLFSKTLSSMFDTFCEGHVKDINHFAIIVDKHEDLVLSFFANLNMRTAHAANSYVVIKKNR